MFWRKNNLKNWKRRKLTLLGKINTVKSVGPASQAYLQCIRTACPWDNKIFKIKKKTATTTTTATTIIG